MADSITDSFKVNAGTSPTPKKHSITQKNSITQETQCHLRNTASPSTMPINVYCLPQPNQLTKLSAALLQLTALRNSPKPVPGEAHRKSILAGHPPRTPAISCTQKPLPGMCSGNQWLSFKRKTLSASKLESHKVCVLG